MSNREQAGLTAKERKALEAVSRFSASSTTKWASASELTSTPGVMGSLVRKGLVNKTEQEERPLHQRAFKYGWYQINEAGRTALANGDGK